MTTTRESGRDAGPVAGTALPKRMPPLDGIRGIGMVAVLVAHASQYRGLSSSSTDTAVLKVLLAAADASRVRPADRRSGHCPPLRSASCAPV